MKDKFSFSVCVTHAQYFGKPILCDAGHASSGVEEDVLSKLFLYIQEALSLHQDASIPPDGYCWMFATYRLPPNYNGQCSSALEEEDRNVFTSYFTYFCTYLLTYSLTFVL